ncbi:pentatricopeptide repeat-containing protein At2g21090-like [Selaginella moellendorffii]|uniref:pentatricopeptide repeat-containing protein At2g21090-like n=1 Tax=Selaginella moellendorffii TaxID=88036 RepID=UPI000D1C97C0|nr:pentatricopeptide repeat-containing protein At2g21090-like [Selaginella moellendorffii]|eukprot:XP_024519815.1 pentatricopeptide repeat-containing protein At2g21090-like [Selaginella moellendorffii]
MYGKCGSLPDARDVFDSVNQPNAFTWNIMIRAYTENGQLLQARILFGNMPIKNVVSWTTMLEAYRRTGGLEEAEDLLECDDIWLRSHEAFLRGRGIVRRDAEERSGFVVADDLRVCSKWRHRSSKGFV